MIGKRVYPGTDGSVHLGRGDYCRGEDGKWILYPPAHDAGLMHASAVKEEKDGTITVAGLIEKGVWLK
jgi:hypothetical protein